MVCRRFVFLVKQIQISILQSRLRRLHPANLGRGIGHNPQTHSLLGKHHIRQLAAGSLIKLLLLRGYQNLKYIALHTLQ